MGECMKTRLKDLILLYIIVLLGFLLIELYIPDSNAKISFLCEEYTGDIKVYYSYDGEYSEENMELCNKEQSGDNAIVFKADIPLFRYVTNLKIEFDGAIEEVPLKKINIRQDFYYENIELGVGEKLASIGENASLEIIPPNINNVYMIIKIVLLFVMASIVYGGIVFAICLIKFGGAAKILRIVAQVVLLMSCIGLLTLVRQDGELIIETDAYLGEIEFSGENYTENHYDAIKEVKTVNIETEDFLNERKFYFLNPAVGKYEMYFRTADWNDTFVIKDICLRQFGYRKSISEDYWNNYIIRSDNVYFTQEGDDYKITITGAEPYVLIDNYAILEMSRRVKVIWSIAILSIYLALAVGQILIPTKYWENIYQKAKQMILGIRNIQGTYILEVFLFFLVLLMAFHDKLRFRFNFLRLSAKMTTEEQLMLLMVSLPIIVSLLYICYRKKQNSFYFVDNCFPAKCGYKILAGFCVLFFLTIVYCYNLGGNNFHNDEHYHVLAAVGYLKTGCFVQWDMVNDIPWEQYDRAWPYTWLVAQSFRIFGISEVSARLVSVICGLIFCTIVYCLVNKITHNVLFSTICTVVLGLNPNLIDDFRMVRMYSLMYVCSLLLLITMWLTLNRENKFKHKNKFTNWIKENFNFHFGFALLSVILMLINYLIMPNPLIMVLGVLMYVIIKYIKLREKKYFHLICLVVFAIALFIGVRVCPDLFPDAISTAVNAFFIHTTGVNGYGASIHVEYLWSVISYPGGIIVGLLLFIAGIFTICKTPRFSSYKEYILSIVTCTFIFFIFFVHRYFQTRYMLFMLPICFFICVLGYYAIYVMLSRVGRVIFGLIGVLLIANIMKYSFGYLYTGENDFAHFDKAYQELADYWGADRPLPLYSYHFRSEYLQQYDKVVFQDYIDNEIENLMDFGEEYRNGIISIESQKYYMHSNTFKYFMENYLKKIGGTGKDGNLVELYEYQFYSPTENQCMEILERRQYSRAISYGVGINLQGQHVFYIKMDMEKIKEIEELADLYGSPIMIAVRICDGKEIYPCLVDISYIDMPGTIYFEVPIGYENGSLYIQNIGLYFGENRLVNLFNEGEE